MCKLQPHYKIWQFIYHKPDVHHHTQMNKILLSLLRCAFRDSNDFEVAQITSLSFIYKCFNIPVQNVCFVEIFCFVSKQV